MAPSRVCGGRHLRFRHRWPTRDRTPLKSFNNRTIIRVLHVDRETVPVIGKCLNSYICSGKIKA
jgi:hypothetical protein